MQGILRHFLVQITAKNHTKFALHTVSQSYVLCGERERTICTRKSHSNLFPLCVHKTMCGNGWPLDVCEYVLYCMVFISLRFISTIFIHYTHYYLFRSLWQLYDCKLIEEWLRRQTLIGVGKRNSNDPPDSMVVCLEWIGLDCMLAP